MVGVSLPDWAREELALRRVMGEWIARSIRDQCYIPYRGGKEGHDEGTFTASWYGYYLLTGEPKVLEFMRHLRDEYLAYSELYQYHGYDDWGEVHHQTEHYIIFLTRLWHLDRADTRTIQALEHGAHHAGNWVPGIPEWYDWEKRRFRSWSLGTRLVQEYPPYDFNVPDHFKVIQMALAAYLATGKARYVELSCDYADMWTDLILKSPEAEPPSVLFPEELSRAERERLYGASGLHGGRSRGAGRRVGVPVVELYYDAPRSQRVELHVASGSLEVFLDLYLLTGRAKYVDAVRKMLPPVVESILDPDAEIPAMLLSKYRWASGDTSFDVSILEKLAQMKEADVSRMVLLAGVSHERSPIVGRTGRRVDQVHWGYQRDDGSIVPEAGASPGSLMLGYEISGDVGLANRALAKARRRMELAVFSLRDGREHGCAAHTVHAVAAGHGRATGAGSVTTTLYPFALGSHRFAGNESPAVRYARADGGAGLPEGVAARWQPSPEGQIHIWLCNSLGEEIAVALSPAEEGAKIQSVAVEGQPHQDFTAERVLIALPPRSELDIRLGVYAEQRVRAYA